MIKIKFTLFKKGHGKEWIESVANKTDLITRFSSLEQAWKVYQGLKEKKQAVQVKRNVVFQNYPNKTEKEIADLAEAQARKVIEDLEKKGEKIKHRIKRTKI